MSHGPFVDLDDLGVRRGHGLCDRQLLSGHAALTEKLSRAENGNDTLFAFRRHDGDLDFSRFDEEDGRCNITLLKYRLACPVLAGATPDTGGRQKFFGVECRATGGHIHGLGNEAQR